MVYYILISIVFIAELIIAGTIISHLMNWSKTFREYSNFLEEEKADIKSIMETSRKISEQLTELAPMCVENVKKILLEIALKNIKNVLVGILIGILWIIPSDWLSFNTKLVIGILFGLPIAALSVKGINQCSLSEFLINFIKFKMNPPTYIKKNVFEKNNKI